MFRWKLCSGDHREGTAGSLISLGSRKCSVCLLRKMQENYWIEIVNLTFNYLVHGFIVLNSDVWIGELSWINRFLLNSETAGEKKEKFKIPFPSALFCQQPNRGKESNFYNFFIAAASGGHRVAFHWEFAEQQSKTSSKYVYHSLSICQMSLIWCHYILVWHPLVLL